MFDAIIASFGYGFMDLIFTLFIIYKLSYNVRITDLKLSYIMHLQYNSLRVLFYSNPLSLLARKRERLNGLIFKLAMKMVIKINTSNYLLACLCSPTPKFSISATLIIYPLQSALAM